MRPFVKKSFFIVIFTVLHLCAIMICGLGLALTIKICTTNPPPPSPEAITLGHVFDILIFPLGTLGFWLSDRFEQTWIIYFLGVANSLCWAVALSHGWSIIKRWIKKGDDTKDF